MNPNTMSYKRRFKKQDPQHELLPKDFGPLGEFWVFWDTHSTIDYKGLMEDVDVHIDLHDVIITKEAPNYWVDESYET